MNGKERGSRRKRRKERRMDGVLKGEEKKDVCVFVDVGGGENIKKWRGQRMTMGEKEKGRKRDKKKDNGFLLDGMQGQVERRREEAKMEEEEERNNRTGNKQQRREEGGGEEEERSIGSEEWIGIGTRIDGG